MRTLGNLIPLLFSALAATAVIVAIFIGVDAFQDAMGSFDTLTQP